MYIDWVAETLYWVLPQLVLKCYENVTIAMVHRCLLMQIGPFFIFMNHIVVAMQLGLNCLQWWGQQVLFPLLLQCQTTREQYNNCHNLRRHCWNTKCVVVEYMNGPSSLMSFYLSSQKRMLVIKYESEIYLFVDFGVFFYNHWQIAFLICTQSYFRHLHKFSSSQKVFKGQEWHSPAR